jgi:hypothetical protein
MPEIQIKGNVRLGRPPERTVQGSMVCATESEEAKTMNANLGSTNRKAQAHQGIVQAPNMANGNGPTQRWIWRAVVSIIGDMNARAAAIWGPITGQNVISPVIAG